MNLGGCISYRDDDEPVEIVPKAIRLHKKNARMAGERLPRPGGKMKELLIAGMAVLAGIAAFLVLRKRVGGDCPV